MFTHVMEQAKLALNMNQHTPSLYTFDFKLLYIYYKKLLLLLKIICE